MATTPHHEKPVPHLTLGVIEGKQTLPLSQSGQRGLDLSQIWQDLQAPSNEPPLLQNQSNREFPVYYGVPRHVGRSSSVRKV